MRIKTALKGFVVAAALPFILASAGCSGGEKAKDRATDATPAGAPAQGAMPSDHPAVAPGAAPGEGGVAKAPAEQGPHGQSGVQREVVLAADVKARWKEARIEVVDGSTKGKEVLTLKVGSTADLKSAPFKLKVESFVPDYIISQNRIESRSNEPNNPAALVELTSGGKTVARGWLFKNFPTFNSFTSERFTLALLGPEGEKK
jgi:hypothetical protein